MKALIVSLLCLVLALVFVSLEFRDRAYREVVTNQWKDEVLKEYAWRGAGPQGDYYKFKSQVLESFIVTRNKNLVSFIQELGEVKRVREIQPLIERYTKQ